MIHELWVEKYRPQRIDDIIGNQMVLIKAQDWFVDYLNNSHTKNALLLSGPPGLGKTTMAHCLLKEYGFRVKEFNASDIRSQKQVEENLHQLIEIDYVDKIYGQSFEPFGIIMDEVDGMLGGDRGGLSTLITFINKTKKTNKNVPKKLIPPIICICNNVDRKISNLVKDCLELKFTRPKEADLIKLIDKICLNEGLMINSEAKQAILTIAQGDYRRLIYFLQFLYQLYNDTNQMIASSDIEKAVLIFNQKEHDLNLSDIMGKILNEKLTIVGAQRIYNNDKTLIPMMMHENYFQAITLHKVDVFQRLDTLSKVARLIVYGDMIDKAMHNHQSWYLQTIHGLFVCYLPNYFFTKEKKTQYCKFKFTTALNQFSLACSNQKAINKIKTRISSYTNYTNSQIHQLNWVLHHLINQGQISDVVELLINYDLRIEVGKSSGGITGGSDLDQILRINRLTGHNLSNSVKSQINKIYNQRVGEINHQNRLKFKHDTSANKNKELLLETRFFKPNVQTTVSIKTKPTIKKYSLVSNDPVKKKLPKPQIKLRKQI